MTPRLPRPGRRERRPRARWQAIILAAVLAAGLGGLGVANAAHVVVRTHDDLTAAMSRCSTATLSVHVSPTGLSFSQDKTAVQITNYPAACYGLTVQVGVSNSAGTLLTSGSATCSAATCVIATGTYTAPQVTKSHVLAGTWGMTSSWDSTCTVILGFIMTCT